VLVQKTRQNLDVQPCKNLVGNKRVIDMVMKQLKAILVSFWIMLITILYFSSHFSVVVRAVNKVLGAIGL